MHNGYHFDTISNPINDDVIRVGNDFMTARYSLAGLEHIGKGGGWNYAGFYQSSDSLSCNGVLPGDKADDLSDIFTR